MGSGVERRSKSGETITVFSVVDPGEPYDIGEVHIDVADGPVGCELPAIGSADWWRRRRHDYLLDRRSLCRVISTILVLTALVNLVPPLIFWRTWLTDWAAPPLPRWVFLQVFASGWMGMYAVFLWQVCHWAALRSVAAAIGAAAFFWGVAAAGLKFGGPRVGWAHWLQMPAHQIAQASLWCLAMLCLCAIVVYLCGREAQHWKRTESLLHQVAGGS